MTGLSRDPSIGPATTLVLVVRTALQLVRLARMNQIRTPDQRLRVFVSSTMNELADERTAAKRAIERLRLTPVLFELGARPYPPRELYLAYLNQSDVFIGIYGQQYGWVAPGSDVSGLEDEFVSAGDKPRLVYVRSPAPDRDPRLAAMLRRVEAERIVVSHLQTRQGSRTAHLRRPGAAAERSLRRRAGTGLVATGTGFVAAANNQGCGERRSRRARRREPVHRPRARAGHARKPAGR